MGEVSQSKGSDVPTGIVAMEDGAIAVGTFEGTVGFGAGEVILQAPDDQGEALVLFRVGR